MNIRAIAVLILVTLMAFQGLSSVGTQTRSGLGDNMEPFSVEDADPWTDGFDDISNVYIPPGGLIGTRVIGGQAKLVAGSSEGWIASSVITAPAGMKYDLVVIEATLPGDSHIEISVLDATTEATEVGYANDTIANHKDLEATVASLKSIDPAIYPKIRIQATLYASGSDRPTIEGWQVLYCPSDEWREDFVSELRIETLRGLNMTQSHLELDLTEHQGRTGRSGGSSGDPYPTIIFDRYQTGGNNVINAFYPNFDRTGYNDVTDISASGTRGLAMDDLNSDGYMDLVCANLWLNSQNPDSQIYWGRSDGTWSQTGATNLDVTRGSDVAIGDFDGDGELDIVFGAYHQTGSTSSCIFLNQGSGQFNNQPDIVFTDMEWFQVGAGDLNGDGYDDVVFGSTGDALAYFGGPGGPDKTPDIDWDFSGFVYEVIVEDLDGDGHMDVIILNNPGDSKVRIHLGSASGPDTTPDHQVTVGDSSLFSMSTGDINNDGYVDMVVMGMENHNRYLYFIKGTSTGWDDTNPHKISTGNSYVYATKVIDINGDGLNDLVAGWNTEMRIFYGTEGTFPDTADITKSGVYSASDVVVAAGSRHTTRKFSGRMVTQNINLAPGKMWDTLVLEGEVPKNTSFTITIKDNANRAIPGLEDITTMDIDLAGLTTPAIKVEIWLESDLNTSTPVLDRLRLRWQDPGTWREQFFGPAKTAQMMGTTIADRQLTAAPGAITGPDLLFTSLKDDEGYNPQSMAVTRTGTITFPARGASAAATGDIDGNGYTDIIFATKQTSGNNYKASSPLFMGTPVGWRFTPDHAFPTVGASDVIMKDINGDGYADVVFAQEYDGDSHYVNSTLFWGSADGWSSTPDVEFPTTGASGVVAVDIDNDGDMDLAFACFKSSSTSTDSMVFLQTDGAFADTPDHRLPTKGARAVVAGDIDDDGVADLVFANSFSGGFAEIDSAIYWGMALGGFDTTPTDIPTSGAEDVKLVDLDTDGDLDLVFANHMNNGQNNSVDSFVYLNSEGTFGTTPDARLPTLGASAVTATDIDGIGLKDLVFSSLVYGEDHTIPSMVYLGGVSGWSATPDMEIATTGASDVVAARIVRGDTAGYLSKTITPKDPSDTGAFDTLKYTAHMQGTRKGTISIVDAHTWEVLASRDLQEGSQDWIVRDEFTFRDHTSVRVMVTITGLDGTGDLLVDNLWLNWTKRVRAPPKVIDMTVADPSIYRTTQTTIEVTVSDEYTPLDLLTVRMEHRLVGTDTWEDNLLTGLSHEDGKWTAIFKAPAKTVLGTYEFRVNVTDTDGYSSGHITDDVMVDVLNRPPTSPTVQMSPARPVTTSALRVEVVQGANDPENFPLTYHYQWFRDGEIIEDLTGDIVSPAYTSRGENWTVEVRAFDGEDEGPSVSVSRIIQNAAPLPVNPLPDPYLDEDTTDSEWLDLSQGFEDPDGDTITWTTVPAPVHFTITIDPATGRVTIEPEADWNGEEEITFVCSDGELQASQKVTITVHPLNDAPEIVSIDGMPVSTDPVEYTIGQGNTLTITPVVVDVEGHELVFDLNTTALDIDGVTGVMTLVPDNDAVGTLRFALSVHDIVSPSVKVKLNFVIHVVNENDPMDDPRISNPADGDQFKANKTFYTTVICYDPDTPFGQVLNYTWTSSVSGLLGYGNTLTLTLSQVGEHIITVTVTDGEFQKTDAVTIEILPADDVGPGPGPGPGSDPDDTPQDTSGSSMTGIIIGLVVALIAAGAGGYVVVSRRKAEPEEEPESEMDQREALQAIADMAKEAADTIEESKNGNNGTGLPNGEDVWVETEEQNGIEVASAGVAETQLSMTAEVTEAAPAEIEALFADIDTNGNGNGTGNGNGNGLSTEDAEQLALDNMKRKYANTIGQLPYGIPSAELKDRDWNDLAAVLASGEKKTVEGDREVTDIDGRWYYSNIDDPSNFLKEHGAKPKAKPQTNTDNSDLLAKLEERFILGEITEETYRELKEKYGN
jgi:hypothetical protein